VDQQIREALSLCEPINAASSLLHVVNRRPDVETISWVAELYELLALDNPSRADALTQSLILRDSSDAPTITENDYKGNLRRESFRAVLHSFLYEILSTAISGPSSDLLAIAPENLFLVGSVISAAATKQGLFSSVEQIGALARGIQSPDSEYEYSDPEVSLLGACLQLLIAGSVFCNAGHLGRNKEQLLPSIE